MADFIACCWVHRTDHVRVYVQMVTLCDSRKTSGLGHSSRRWRAKSWQDDNDDSTIESKIMSSVKSRTIVLTIMCIHAAVLWATHTRTTSHWTLIEAVKV